MRARWFRFSIRTLMVIVAVAGVAFFLLNRRERFKTLARQYAAIASWEPTCNLPPTRGTPEYLRWKESQERERPGRESFLNLSLKYERAARYPWLPVAPDKFEPFPSLPVNWREMLRELQIEEDENGS